MESAAAPIQRHKTAIRRPGFSLPVNCLLRDSLLDASRTFFDYGCGHGQDLNLLQGSGISCAGWDPVHRPQTDPTPADVVNLGYVINVIENPQERGETLRRAWDLTRGILVVGAQGEFAAANKELPSFNDGVLTSRGTFQKYYSQAELKAYIERQLETDAVPAAPGVFYVFRTEDLKQQYLANRFRRQASAPQPRISEALFEEHRDVLNPFIAALARLGRMPAEDELPEASQIIARLGSLKRAFAVVQRVTDAEPWAAIGTRRREDLLVYLALARFQRRPALSKLPLSLQRDIRAFLGTYERACREADELLFTTGDPTAIDLACEQSPVGLLRSNGLLVRHEAIDRLSPLLRVYEGCARALLGQMDEANIIKLHRVSGKVSYLVYRGLEGPEPPELLLRVKVALRTLRIDYISSPAQAG
jgi:DNA phosphorothioation-associated putative methyltransferase